MGLVPRLYKSRQLGPRKGFPAGPAWCRKHRFNLIRAAILASSVALMLPGAWGHSVTVVEFAQLPAGLAAWQSHSLGIYRVCGPVSKLLYALPAHLMGVRVDYPAPINDDVNIRQEWEVGRLFQVQNVKRYHDIYRWSRLLPMLLTVLGGCLVCEWSTRLFGAWPGIVSLCTWCWLPPILGHGSLVTSDMPSTVFLLLAARTFWRFLIRPGAAAAFLAGVALGLAQATKFTLLVLGPCWLVLLFIRAIQRPDTGSNGRPGRAGSTFRLLTLGLGTFGVSVLVMDALYGFQDVGFALSEWRSCRSSLVKSLNALERSRATDWILRVPLPIPLELLRGIDFQLADTERSQSAYLLGRTQLGGWWYWYAVSFLLKVPLPVVALFTIAVARPPFTKCGREPAFWAILCLLLPAAEVALTVSATTGTGTNAAFRYLLPSLGLLCVAAGRVWSPFSNPRKLSIIGLFAWLALDAVVAVPDHIGSQNEVAWAWSRVAGEPALIGDGLDWGQDLARLRAWISGHASEGTVCVCVYGMGAGEPYGLGPPSALSTSAGWEKCTYLAVSANILFGYEPPSSVQVAGGRSSIDEQRRTRLLDLRPWGQIGRTIWVFRLRDLVRGAPSPGVDSYQ